MKIREFICEMEKLYPKSSAAPWDHDGLQCCADPERELRRVLVALDATEEVIDHAVKGEYDLVLTHHPMLFGSVGDIVPSELYGRKIIKLIAGGVATASYHTRIDAGKDGVNDILAAMFFLENVAPYGDEEHPSIGRIGELPEEMSADELCHAVREKLHAPYVRLSGKGMIKTLAVLGGAGKSCIPSAMAAGADAILTGEVSYNSVIDFADMGIAVIEAGHYYTEFPVCRRLAELVQTIAEAEADIFKTAPQKYF
ncbi:MAG: Nif3-like dinuclear metal center hexameric protein [Clostridia bacterium]|nr:Nif3-like dinuclear metal center hexameric protein [Clostridia bacterium]